MADRTALLVRVGIDSSYGGWNAPVNPYSLEFAYVSIPEDNEKSRFDQDTKDPTTHFRNLVDVLRPFSQRGCCRRMLILIPISST